MQGALGLRAVGRHVLVAGDPVAAGEVVSCAAGCPVLQVTNTRTGADTEIPPGPGFRFIESYNGAFSPDGRFAAVPSTTREGQSRVAVVDLRRRLASLVRGATLAPDYTLIAWSSTGWLLFNAGHGRVGAYHRGSTRATLVDLRVQTFESMVAN